MECGAFFLGQPVYLIVQGHLKPVVCRLDQVNPMCGWRLVSMPESGSPPLWPPTLSMSWYQDMTHTQSTWTISTGISSPLPTLMDTPILLTLTDCGERPGHHREEDVSVLIQTETGTSIGEVSTAFYPFSIIFSCESSSRNTNVRRSVSLSMTKRFLSL